MKNKKLNQNQCIEQGKRLRRCLSERKMKQKDFADKCGFTAQYVSNMINGKGIPAENIDLFAEILEVSPDYLSLKSNYMNSWDEISIELNRQQKADNACMSFLESLGYKIQDFPAGIPTYQVSFTPDEDEQAILQKIRAAKGKAKEQPETVFRIVTPSGKRKQVSRHDLLRTLAELQAFSRSYMEVRIGK